MSVQLHELSENGTTYDDLDRLILGMGLRNDTSEYDASEYLVMMLVT